MTDTPLEVKLISQQQAAPVAVPDELSDEIIASMGWHLDPAEKDELRRLYRAMQEAAPTPPAQQPVAAPDAWRELVSAMAREAAHYDAVPGVHIDDSVELWQQPRVMLALTAGHLRKARALLSAAPTPPAQQSQWVPVSARLPEVAAGDEQELIVCVRRARNGESYVFAARYLNQYPLYTENHPDSDDEGCVAHTGWYDVKEHREYDGWYSPLIDASSGDEVTHWMPLPSTPGDTGDTAAPEQSGYRIGFRDGAAEFACYMLDNCERETVYEESLQQWLDDMLRKHPATPAHQQAEQPDHTRELINKLVEGLKWALNEISIEPFEHCSGDNADAHRAAIDAVAEARALLGGDSK